MISPTVISCEDDKQNSNSIEVLEFLKQLHSWHPILKGSVHDL
jgi:hypothetical protein